MRVLTPLVLGVLLAVGMGVAAFAQREGDLSRVGALSRRATYKLGQAEIRSVLRSVAASGDVELQITPAAEQLLERKINIDLTEVPLESMLKVFLKAADCSYTIVGERTLLITAS